MPQSIVDKLESIKRFTPAELLFLIKTGNPDLKYKTKLIILHLLFQKVLDAIEYQYVDGPYNPHLAHVYIAAGHGFSNHSTMAYESIFITPIKKNAKEHWWCKPYLIDCLSKINYKNSLSQVSQSIQKKSNFKMVLKWGTMPSQQTVLTKQAVELSLAVQNDLAIISKVLYYLIDHDKQAAQKLIDDLGAYVLFMPGYQISYLPYAYQSIMLEIERLS